MELSFHVVAILLCLSGLHTVHGQFEDLSECLTGDFIGQFISCLFAGTSTIDLSSIPEPGKLFGESTYEGEESIIGSRHIMAVGHDFENIPRKYILDMKMKKLGIDDNNFYKDVTSWARLLASGDGDESLSRRIKEVNLKKFITNEYITKFTDHFSDILRTSVYLRHASQKTRLHGKYMGFTQPYVEGLWCSVLDEISPGLCAIVTCLENYPPAAFEDGLDWLQCLVTCNDLAPFSICAVNLFQSSNKEACQRVSWFSDVLVGIISSALNKSSCVFKVEQPFDLSQPIILEEGGLQQNFSFKMYVPPGVMCLGPDPLGDPLNLGLIIVGYVFGFDVTCNVEMQLTSANWLDDVVPYLGPLSDRTKCRVPNRASRQVVVGFHSAAVNNSAVFKITPSNWNETFNIPLLPVVDHRKDDDVTVNFTMKLFVQDQMRGETIKFPVKVLDSDYPGPVECYSINDPHIATFDARLYNNFYQGAFYLYKHDLLPYEVQVVYQPCQRNNNNASCTCATAVKSGDEVFVMDRCRRKSCANDGCSSMQQTIMYTNGAITQGTKVFKMDGGLRHDVLLPHGTIVRIVTSNDLLNVWIIPGSHDMNSTSGLCGTYNGNPTDDLMLPDGSLYNNTEYDSSNQPKGFIEAWRVQPNDMIFYGVEKNDSFIPLDACHCTHVLYQGADCECGRDVVTELCDFGIDGDYGINITSIVTATVFNLDPGSFLDDIDLDESYVPPENLPDWGPEWNATKAESFCKDLIHNSNNSFIKICRRDQALEFEDSIQFCKEDLQILDNTEWKFSSVDNAKFHCLNKLVHDKDTSVADIEAFANSSCINQCNDKGQCINGECLCYSGNWGADCSLDTETKPEISERSTQLCDNRNQLCHFATVTGYHFAENIDMRCEVRNVEITSQGIEFLPRRKTSLAKERLMIISMNQAVCPLPGNGSYEITVAWRVKPDDEDMASIMISNHDKQDDPIQHSSEVTFIYIAYDSVCFECDIDSNSCSRKQTKDYCWIENGCWSRGQTKLGDGCRSCDPEVSINTWTPLNTSVCDEQMAAEAEEMETTRKDKILRGALGGCISALVVIIVIIIFCVTHNKDKKHKMSESEMMRSSSVILQKGTDYFESQAFDNPAMVARDDDGLATGSYNLLYNGQEPKNKEDGIVVRTDENQISQPPADRGNIDGKECVDSDEMIFAYEDAIKTAL